MNYKKVIFVEVTRTYLSIIAFDEGERKPNLALGAWGRRSQAKEIEILWADHFLLAILNILPRSGVFTEARLGPPHIFSRAFGAHVLCFSFRF